MALAAAVERYEVGHPVLDDPELVTWGAYTARAWPTLVVIDPEGYIVAQMAGEGHGSAIAALVTDLIAEHAAKGTLHRGAGPYVPPAPASGTLRFPAKALALPNGNLLVADAGHHSLAELAPDGETLVRRIGSGERGLVDGGPDEARFSEPNGLVPGAGGTAYAPRLRRRRRGHGQPRAARCAAVRRRRLDRRGHWPAVHGRWPGERRRTRTVGRCGAYVPGTAVAPLDLAAELTVGPCVVAGARRVRRGHGRQPHPVGDRSRCTELAALLAGTMNEGLEDGPGEACLVRADLRRRTVRRRRGTAGRPSLDRGLRDVVAAPRGALRQRRRRAGGDDHDRRRPGPVRLRAPGRRRRSGAAAAPARCGHAARRLGRRRRHVQRRGAPVRPGRRRGDDARDGSGRAVGRARRGGGLRCAPARRGVGGPPDHPGAAPGGSGGGGARRRRAADGPARDRRRRGSAPAGRAVRARPWPEARRPVGPVDVAPGQCDSAGAAAVRGRRTGRTCSGTS